MGKIISFANQKGGVGKTTSAVNIASSLGVLGYKVLLIDLDPQGNATSGVGIVKKNLKVTAFDMLTGDTTAEEATIKTRFNNLSVIPTNTTLARAEFELADVENGEYIMKKKLENAKKEYDYIIIDCPPSLGMLTVNAMTASDGVVIPMQCEFFALEGLGKLLQTIRLVQAGPNKELTIEGFVVTMFDGRTKVHNQVLGELKEHFGAMVFNTIIQRNIRLSEAPSHGKPIILYDVICNGTTNYLNLAKEVLERNTPAENN